MDLTNKDVQQHLGAIFMPHAAELQEKMRIEGARFVHYTSAENALKIIQGGEIWMRDTRCMNDYSEVIHGYQHLKQYFDDPVKREAFCAPLNSCGEGISTEAFAMFNQQWEKIQQGTYITSLSEHDASEDPHGRLSMWRSYGRGSAGVAIVLRLPMTGSAMPMRLFLSPVAYFTPDRVASEIERVAAKLAENRDILRGLDRDFVIRMTYMMFMMTVVSMKHPGFHEEREWRVIHAPTQFPSPFINAALETIGGIPQWVCKIPLKNNPDAGVSGIELSEMLDRVIIGPTVYPGPVASAFIAALTQAGVPDAANKVVISDIPLRT